MRKYLLHRFLGMLVVMLIVVTTVFLIVRVAPGDPASVMLGVEATAEDIDELRRKLGLNDPLYLQYLNYVGQLLKGDLGESIFLRRSVSAALMERAEPTFFLALFSLLVGCVIALPIGILAAYYRGSKFDQIATSVAMVFASIPSFWLSLLLIQIVAVKLGVLPVSGYGNPDSGFLERVRHLLLPSLALGVIVSAIIMRFTRASMIEALNNDFIRTARSKGASEWRVVMRHALRNGLIPIITVIGLVIGSLVSGAIVVETVFGLPGIGNLVVSAVLRRDYPVIQGALLTIAVLYVVVNFIIDMTYLLVDKRVRY
ncbi:ABC transporter permease [Pusillimonas sp. SM2304]|uniref:ABC transporter permease n=1 Tax=Pusillimonas sp. SM2304 TaxID=3073241 RepID=UPI0028742CB8|nr:ABC transporter permease [Pusillimonas sp. SM2304]MDS1140114.1 ABC transporter permease [Pusillimonas sp. SM2304]